MPLRHWLERAQPVAGAPGFTALRLDREEWSRATQRVAAGGGRLLALWITPGLEPGAASWVRASFLLADGGGVLIAHEVAEQETYPSLHEQFPAAIRLQRAAYDLTGVASSDVDRRPWLRHAAWSADEFPLRDAQLMRADEPALDDYEFVRVAGEGVHEIAVGPVHAGIIEPGHFRFSVVGEKVLRLEERLGYVHKGIERRFRELPILAGHRLAARVSGDSAVAFSWAYCQALEGMADASIPPRAAWLRALALELERIANHLGDLGALGNDAGLAIGLAHFSRLKEILLRATEAALGQRYLLDYVVPGGVAVDPSMRDLEALVGCVDAVAAETLQLKAIYADHAGVQDRFVTAGQVTPELAARLGLIGLAGRASRQAFDVRADLPCAPYVELEPQKVVHADGDVAARVMVRFDEIAVSARLIGEIAARLPVGPTALPVPEPQAGALGVGLAEAWRGPVFVALEAGTGGAIRRCHPHDVSWQNWPVLEHAIVGNIVPDFPLINKSFNLSYSGHDL